MTRITLVKDSLTTCELASVQPERDLAAILIFMTYWTPLERNSNFCQLLQIITAYY